MNDIAVMDLAFTLNDEPVSTNVEPRACRATKSCVAASAIASTTPPPPGTQIRSNCGAPAKSTVGNND